MKKNSDARWTNAEVEILLEFGKKLSDKDLHILIPGHTLTGICSKRKRVGIINDKKWTKEEKNLLKKCKGRNIEELTKMFPNRTKIAILKKTLKSKARDKFKIQIPWTKEEDDFLIKNGTNLSSTEMKNFFNNRKSKDISARCFKLGIHKTKECKTRLGLKAQKCLDTESLRKLDQNLTLEDLDNTTYQILIGSLLGDGCVTKSKSSKAYHFVEGHGWKQKDYVLWKRKKLKIFEPNYNKNNVITTPCHNIFDKLRELFYNDKCKYFIPLNIVEKLDLLGLMIWYLDDGYLGRPKSGLKCTGASRKTYPHITCKGYDYNNLLDVCGILNEKYNFSLYVKQSKHRDGFNKILCMNNDKNYIFSIWKKIAKKLQLPDCMYYKLD